MNLIYESLRMEENKDLHLTSKLSINQLNKTKQSISSNSLS